MMTFTILGIPQLPLLPKPIPRPSPQRPQISLLTIYRILRQSNRHSKSP